MKVFLLAFEALILHVMGEFGIPAFQLNSEKLALLFCSSLACGFLNSSPYNSWGNIFKYVITFCMWQQQRDWAIRRGQTKDEACLNSGFICYLPHSFQKTTCCLFAWLQQCLSYLDQRSIMQISTFIPVLHLTVCITTYWRLSLQCQESNFPRCTTAIHISLSAHCKS